MTVLRHSVTVLAVRPELVRELASLLWEAAESTRARGETVLRGRWLLRPVAAVVLLLAGGPLRRGFRDAVERAAEGWNEAVGRLLELGPDGIREELARQAAQGRPDQDASKD